MDNFDPHLQQIIIDPLKDPKSWPGLFDYRQGVLFHIGGLIKSWLLVNMVHIKLWRNMVN